MRKFTIKEAETHFRYNYERLYQTAADGQNKRLIQALWDKDAITGQEVDAMIALNEKLAAQVGTPEPKHVRAMDYLDIIRYLRPELWRAEQNLLYENHIPKPALPPDGRRDEILERNYYVALIRAIYILFPDEPRKLTPGDLMAEFFDDPTPDEAPEEPAQGVSP